ncbi:MAG: glycerol-3-phosphate dehydrogenase [Solirubrobacteraceae bacterium]|jgi:glycerol-3-phosphate dehydrogenase|nr:glycerol-3-phosphate dehydrogenase [Solirubrobacteraceae bacterium]
MSHGIGALSAARRATDLAALAGGEVVDVLVVGGGITGAGVALDAASRGLSVALLERRDLAHGTSRWSSKLVHGGLRYLAQGDVALAWESARERAILMDVTAPHLVRALPILMPLHAGTPRAAAATAHAGMRIGDGMRALARTSRRRLPRARRAGAEEAWRYAPALRRDGLRGALLGWDGQLEDDARLVVAVARTAAAHGARIVTYAAVTEVGRGEAAVRDERTGERFVVRARHVVNAAGVWAGALAPGLELRPSRGAHVLVAAERLGDPRGGITVPVPGERHRYVFALPRPDGLVLVGLTDDPVEGDVPDEEPSVAPADEAFLLGVVSTVLEEPLGPADVVGRFSGLRPLLAGAGPTADLSRRHAVVEDPATGTLTLVGGKLTTYRRMAQDAVDRIAARPDVSAGPCVTHRLALVGARGAAPVGGARTRLERRYGAEAADVAALAHGDPELLEPLAPGVPACDAELRFAVERELGLTEADLLDRRTRLGLIPAWRAAAEPAARAALAAVAA